MVVIETKLQIMEMSSHEASAAHLAGVISPINRE